MVLDGMHTAFQSLIYYNDITIIYNIYNNRSMVSVYEIIPWKLSQNRRVKRYEHASDRTLHRMK